MQASINKLIIVNICKLSPMFTIVNLDIFRLTTLHLLSCVRNHDQGFLLLLKVSFDLFVM